MLRSTLFVSLICVSASAQTPCGDSSITPSSLTITAGAPCWILSNESMFFDGLGMGISYVPCTWGSTGALDVRMSMFDGSIGDAGLLLGYRPGDESAPAPEYLALLTNGAPDSPLRLLRVTEPLSAQGELQNPQLLAESTINHFAQMDLSVWMSSTAVHVTLGALPALSAAGDFSHHVGDGRVALASWGQAVTWQNIHTRVGTPASVTSIGPGCSHAQQFDLSST